MLWRKQTAPRAHPRVLRITGHRARIWSGKAIFSAQTAPSNNRCPCYCYSFFFLSRSYSFRDKDTPFLKRTERRGYFCLSFVLEYWNFFREERTILRANERIDWSIAWMIIKIVVKLRNLEKYFRIFKLIFIYTLVTVAEWKRGVIVKSL